MSHTQTDIIKLLNHNSETSSALLSRVANEDVTQDNGERLLCIAKDMLADAQAICHLCAEAANGRGEHVHLVADNLAEGTGGTEPLATIGGGA